MNVRTLCLSILYDEEASGYERLEANREAARATLLERTFRKIRDAER